MAKNSDFWLILFCGSELPSKINVWVQFRVSFSFTLLQKKVLFCRFSGGNLPIGNDPTRYNISASGSLNHCYEPRAVYYNFPEDGWLCLIFTIFCNIHPLRYQISGPATIKKIKYVSHFNCWKVENFKMEVWRHTYLST